MLAVCIVLVASISNSNLFEFKLSPNPLVRAHLLYPSRLLPAGRERLARCGYGSGERERLGKGGGGGARERESEGGREEDASERASERGKREEARRESRRGA